MQLHVIEAYDQDWLSQLAAQYFKDYIEPLISTSQERDKDSLAIKTEPDMTSSHDQPDAIVVVMAQQ